MVERARPDLASAMYPALSHETKAREAALECHAAENQRRKAELLADLRELNRKIDARSKREASKQFLT
jgi:hypothetical protein